MIKNAFKNILYKPSRSILTILAVSISIFSMILIDTISNAGTQAVSAELNSLGMNGMTVSGNSMVYAEISEDDIGALKSIESIEAVAPVILMSSTLASSDEGKELYLWGIEENAKNVVDLKLLYGRYFNESDLNLKNPVCLVDTSFAQNVYKRDNIVGKTITINTNGIIENYDVIGVIKTGGAIFQNFMGSYIPDFVYIPLGSAQDLLQSDKYHRALLKIDSNYSSDYVKTLIEKKLTNNGTTYSITNLSKEKESLDNILNIFALILSCIGAIAFIVASIGIMCIMLVSVSERTREIGIKKSIGSSNRIIIFEFLTESLLLSVLGCLIGIVLSYTVTFIASYSLNYNIIINFIQVLKYLFISAMTGIIFGVYPAYKASKLTPVNALTR